MILTVFPKLTPTHLSQLRGLYRKWADPPEGIITFWAGRIGVERTEVVAWIQYQQEKAKEKDAGAPPESPDIPLKQLVSDSASASVSPTVLGFPRPHLPTPAKSSLSPSTSPHTRMPSLPPIAVKVEDFRQCLSPVSSSSTPLSDPRPANYARSTESHSALEGLPPLSRLQTTVRRFSAGPDVRAQPARQTKSPTIATSVPSAWSRVGGQPHSRDSNTTLEASIRDSLRPDATPSEQPPRTADEFAEKFERVGNMIEVFMKKYDSGQLVRLGWDSSALSFVLRGRAMLMFPRFHQSRIMIGSTTCVTLFMLHHTYSTVFLYGWDGYSSIMT